MCEERHLVTKREKKLMNRVRVIKKYYSETLEFDREKQREKLNIALCHVQGFRVTSTGDLNT